MPAVEEIKTPIGEDNAFALIGACVTKINAFGQTHHPLGWIVSQHGERGRGWKPETGGEGEERDEAGGCRGKGQESGGLGFKLIPQPLGGGLEGLFNFPDGWNPCLREELLQGVAVEAGL